MTAEKFVKALGDALALHAKDIDEKRWGDWAYRTHWMLGRAIKGKAPARKTFILRTVMKDLDYRWHRRDPRPSDPTVADRTWTRERWGLDLGAVESPVEWDRACWEGRWRTTLALEVENDIQEFSLTMRGLLDVQAQLRVGVFYANEPLERVEDLRVGVGPRDENTRVRLGNWTPPWTEPNTGSQLADGGQIAAIFVSCQRPAVLGVQPWR